MENKFYNELSKFKKAEKDDLKNIELSLVDDLKDLHTKAFKEIRESKPWKQDLKTVKKAIDNDVDKYEKLEIELQKLRTKFRQQADILGVDFKKVPEWQKANDPRVVGYNFYRANMNKDGRKLTFIDDINSKYINFHSLQM